MLKRSKPALQIHTHTTSRHETEEVTTSPFYSTENLFQELLIRYGTPTRHSTTFIIMPPPKKLSLDNFDESGATANHALQEQQIPLAQNFHRPLITESSSSRDMLDEAMTRWVNALPSGSSLIGPSDGSLRMPMDRDHSNYNSWMNMKVEVSLDNLFSREIG